MPFVSGTERTSLRIVTGFLLAVFLPAAHALAQQAAAPAPEPGAWTGTAGAGLALTAGNSDTSTFNVSFDLTRDAKTRDVMKWTGLYLRGSQNDTLAANQLSLSFRDQHTLNARSYVFGQISCLRDTFKAIDYLVAPTVGAGYKVLDTPRTKFSIDGGLGVLWEKNTDVDVRTSAALTASEKLEHTLTATSTIKHAATALWKASDLSDGLYTFAVGLGTRISERVQLSIDLLDTFKNQPPSASVKKNDVALVTAVTAKF